MKKYLNLAKSQLRKKFNLLHIIIITMFIFLVFVLGSFIETQKYFIKIGRFNDPLYKVLLIKSSDYTGDELIELVSDWEHIIGTRNGAYFQRGAIIEQLATEKFSGGIWMINIPNEALPPITYGTNFPDDNGYYMICPDLFFPGINYEEERYLSKKDAINKKENLNKEFNFSYFGAEYVQSNNSNYIFEMDIKLIGFYEGPFSSHNTCYVNDKVIKEYVDNEYLDDSNRILDKDAVVIYIDEYKNVRHIINKLDDLDISSTSYISFLTEQVEDEIDFINAIMLFIYVILFVLVFLLFQKDFIGERKYYKLLSYLGYSKDDIRKTYLVSTLIKILFCIVISLIVLVLGVVIFNIVLYYKPFLFYERKIIYSLGSVLISIGIILLTIFVNVLYNYKGVNFCD